MALGTRGQDNPFDSPSLRHWTEQTEARRTRVTSQCVCVCWNTNLDTFNIVAYGAGLYKQKQAATATGTTRQVTLMNNTWNRQRVRPSKLYQVFNGYIDYQDSADEFRMPCIMYVPLPAGEHLHP